MIIQKKILAFSFSALLFSSLYAQEDSRRSEAYYQIEARFIEAENERMKGKIDEALEIYKSLLKEPEALAAVQFKLAQIYDARDENEAAVKAAKAAITADPNNEWYHKLLGDLYQKTGNDAAAVEVYRTLVKKKPDYPYYHYKLAYFLVRANQAKQAQKVYENLEERIGVNEELSRRKHTLFLGLGDKGRAEKEILRLIEVYPYELDYRHFLAGFYESNGEKGKAKKVYEYILSKNPSDTEAQMALAEDKQATSADDDFVEALKPNFSNPDIKIDAKIIQILPLIQQVADENNRGLADKLLELSEILEKTHDDAKAYSIAGDLYYYTNRKVDAIAKYEETIKRNETILLVWEQYLKALTETQQWQKLLDRSEDALDVFPNQGVIHLLNGKGYGRVGQHAQALGALQQAQMMSFNNPPLQYDILIETGEQYHFLKKYEKSDESFQKAIDLNSNGAKGLARYAYFLAQRKENLGEAEKIAEKAVKTVPNQAEYEAALAAVYFAKKDYKKAVAQYDKAVQNMPFADARILEGYGDALLKNGDENGAITQWKKALEAGGKANQLNKKIREKTL